MGKWGSMLEEPMLNSPVQVQSDAAEEFAKKAISRLEGAHHACQALKTILSEAVQPPVKANVELVERDKRRFTALVNIFNRKTFGAAG
jgi:hypothetical protein